MSTVESARGVRRENETLDNLSRASRGRHRPACHGSPARDHRPLTELGVLLAFHPYPIEHRIHLRTSKLISKSLCTPIHGS